jgi:hypothetical protein
MFYSIISIQFKTPYSLKNSLEPMFYENYCKKLIYSVFSTAAMTFNDRQKKNLLLSTNEFRKEKL